MGFKQIQNQLKLLLVPFVVTMCRLTTRQRCQTNKKDKKAFEARYVPPVCQPNPSPMKGVDGYVKPTPILVSTLWYTHPLLVYSLVYLPPVSPPLTGMPTPTRKRDLEQGIPTPTQPPLPRRGLEPGMHTLPRKNCLPANTEHFKIRIWKPSSQPTKQILRFT